MNEKTNNESGFARFIGKIIEWYRKNKYIVNTVLILILGFLVLLAIATSFFRSPVGNHYDPTALSIGDFHIQWYAIFIMYGIACSVVLGRYELVKKNIDVSILYDGLLLCVPVAIVGCRLYYVFANWSDGWTFLEILGWNGSTFELSGLAIQGGMLAVAAVLIPFCKFKKISYGLIIDIALPAFLIGQTIGRWGNFMNAELYGPVIKSQGLLNILPNFITDQLWISEVDRYGVLQEGFRHPTFLYEGMLNMVGFIVIAVIRRKKITLVGELGAMYLIWYGIVRGALIEPLRYFGGSPGDSMLTSSGFPMNVLLSIFMVIGGILVIVAIRVYSRYKKKLPYYVDVKEVRKVKRVKSELADGTNEELTTGDDNDKDNTV